MAYSNNNEAPLPYGWIKEFDSAQNAWYYVDTSSPNPRPTWLDPRQSQSVGGQYQHSSYGNEKASYGGYSQPNAQSTYQQTPTDQQSVYQQQALQAAAQSNDGQQGERFFTDSSKTQTTTQGTSAFVFSSHPLPLTIFLQEAQSADLLPSFLYQQTEASAKSSLEPVPESPQSILPRNSLAEKTTRSPLPRSISNLLSSSTTSRSITSNSSRAREEASSAACSAARTTGKRMKKSIIIITSRVDTAVITEGEGWEEVDLGTAVGSGVAPVRSDFPGQGERASKVDLCFCFCFFPSSHLSSLFPTPQVLPVLLHTREVPKQVSALPFVLSFLPYLPLIHPN
jgi:hypothetical protein